MKATSRPGGHEGRKEKMMKTKIDRNKETSRKLDAMWNSLSEKARDVIATTDMCIVDDLFGNLDTPEEVNKFIEEEWSDDDEE